METFIKFNFDNSVDSLTKDMPANSTLDNKLDYKLLFYHEIQNKYKNETEVPIIFRRNKYGIIAIKEQKKNIKLKLSLNKKLPYNKLYSIDVTKYIKGSIEKIETTIESKFEKYLYLAGTSPLLSKVTQMNFKNMAITSSHFKQNIIKAKFETKQPPILSHNCMNLEYDIRKASGCVN